MQKSLIITLLFTLFTLTSKSQCNITNHAFNSGEVATYDAYYNWHFIWLKAGIVKFSVRDKDYKGKDTWFLSAYGKTHSTYDHLMTVRDTFETYVDKTTFDPLFFNRVTKEGSTVSHHQYYFDYNKKQIHTHIRKGTKYSYKDSTIVLNNCISDLLTMVYKARNLNYSLYNVGEKIPINMIIDGKSYSLYIRYLGKGIMKTKEGRKFRCLKFTPCLVKGTIFSAGENMIVWVTDDRNKIPIMVESKILIGSVKAMFIGVKGARYPLTSEILN